MRHFILAAALLPSVASAQSLVGDTIQVRPFSFPNTTPITVVEPGVDLVDAGPILGFAGSTGRLDIDVTADTIRVDFTVVQTLGFNGPLLTFEDLDPVCPDGQIGDIVGVTVDTNIDPARILLGLPSYQGNASFTADSVAIDQVAQVNYDDGDYIELQLDIDCPPPQPLTLLFQGTCPGPVYAEASNMTPGGQLAVVRGTGLGTTIIPVGPCAGTALGLTGAALVTFVNDNDNDGLVSATPNLGPNYCGTPIQVVDMTTCAVSNVTSP
jgi:hypothetical protein